jgi:transcription antitermination protein NusB
MNTIRRAARELALNILYQVDVVGMPLDEAIATAVEYASAAPESVEYAKTLARGAKEYREIADTVVNALSPEWPSERQPAVDRNILRMAIYEVDCIEYVPPIVSVDEAVELAKKYSTADSGKFVNGVLAAYLRQKENKEQKIASTDSERK